MPRSTPPRGSSSSPARVPPRSQHPRWHGDPHQRPPTDAEVTKTQRRNQSLARFAVFVVMLAIFDFVLAPTTILALLQQAPGALAPFAERLGWWLQIGHPLAKAALVAGLGATLLYLCVGAGMLVYQVQQRRKAVLHTVLVDLPRTPTPELGRGVDLFAGVGDLLNTNGRVWGNEDVLVFALVNNTEDNKVRLALRSPVRQTTQTDYLEAIRNLIAGISPGATTRPAPDDLQNALSQVGSAGEVVGYADFILGPCAS